MAWRNAAEEDSSAPSNDDPEQTVEQTLLAWTLNLLRGLYARPKLMRTLSAEIVRVVIIGGVLHYTSPQQPWQSSGVPHPGAVSADSELFIGAPYSIERNRLEVVDKFSEITRGVPGSVALLDAHMDDKNMKPIDTSVSVPKDQALLRHTVRSLQIVMKYIGEYDGPLDSEPLSLGESVRNFQNKHGLQRDSRVGPLTWRAIKQRLEAKDAPGADDPFLPTTPAVQTAPPLHRASR